MLCVGVGNLSDVSGSASGTLWRTNLVNKIYHLNRWAARRTLRYFIICLGLCFVYVEKFFVLLVRFFSIVLKWYIFNTDLTLTPPISTTQQLHAVKSVYSALVMCLTMHWRNGLDKEHTGLGDFFCLDLLL